MLSLLYGPTLTSIHDYRKNHSFDCMTFVSKVMSLLCNILSRFVIAFPLRNKCLLISWLQSPSTMILESKKIKSVTVSSFPSSIYHEVMGLDTMILIFWILSQFFHSPLSPSSRGSLSITKSMYILVLCRTYFTVQSWKKLPVTQHQHWENPTA